MILNKQPKPKTAIALEYNPDEAAPKVIATGKGLVAEKIIEKAKEENRDMIPPELYEAVAEILVFVDALEKIKKKGK